MQSDHFDVFPPDDDDDGSTSDYWEAYLSMVADCDAAADYGDVTGETPRVGSEEWDLPGFHILTDSELEQLADEDYDQVNDDIAAWYEDAPLEAAIYFGDFGPVGDFDDADYRPSFIGYGY